jgi:hypothetical protein
LFECLLFMKTVTRVS